MHVIKQDEQPHPDLTWPLGAAGGALNSLLGGDPSRAGELLDRMAPVFVPSYDLKETREDFRVVADLPGLSDQDVDVEIQDNCLTITGERAQDRFEEGECYYALDRHFGTFCLTFRLPGDLDAERIDAKLWNGVLVVKVPKRKGASATRVLVAKGH